MNSMRKYLSTPAVTTVSKLGLVGGVGVSYRVAPLVELQAEGTLLLCADRMQKRLYEIPRTALQHDIRRAGRMQHHLR